MTWHDLHGQVDQGAFGKLPDKEQGKHRWVATVAYTLRSGQASAAYGGSTVILDAENRVAGPLIGCWDCEQDFQDAKGKPCRVDDDEARSPDADYKQASDNVKQYGSRGDVMLLGRFLAAVKLIERTGPDDVAASHSDIDGPNGIAWKCVATYGDKKIESFEFPYPAQAAEDLLAKVLNGGTCLECERTTILGVSIDGYCARTLVADDVDNERSYHYERACDK